MGKSLKTGDRILLAILAASALACAAAFAFGGFGDQGPVHAGNDAEAMVVCQTKSGFYRADPLSSTVKYTVDTPATGSGPDADGGENTILIQDGKVDVVGSNCSNQVCADHDAIDEPGEQIVCLPHGLVVEVVQDEDMASKLV